MRIDVTGRHFEVTDAISTYAESKAEKLPKYYNGVQEIEVVLEELPHSEFMSEIRVDVVKHSTFVATAKGEDVYGCIDQSMEKMTRQLTDFKQKLKDNRG
jgi:putative sigma-54 modulation protein